jgi:hypothetical protein
MQINPVDIYSFFREQKGVFESRYGVVMKMSKDEDSLYTNYQMPVLSEMSINLRLTLDVDSVDSFIAGFKLQQIKDIDRISYEYMWMRYLNGGGAFYAEHRDLRCEIGFRLISYKTIAFCKEIHFYDEMNKHLTMPDEFDWWVVRNLQKVRGCELRIV